jgi:hypothetical protein
MNSSVLEIHIKLERKKVSLSPRASDAIVEVFAFGLGERKSFLEDHSSYSTTFFSDVDEVFVVREGKKAKLLLRSRSCT